MKGELIRIFYERSVVKNPLPVNYNPEDAALFERERQIQLPQSGLFRLNDVYVTDLGIIYKNFSAVKENIICYDIDFKSYRFRYLLKAFLSFKRQKYKDSNGIIIFDNYSGPKGFAHWLCDGLTRLIEITDMLDRYTVIVPNYFKDEAVYRESMELFGIKNIHYLPSRSLTFFEALHFPSPIAETGNFHPENVKKLRALVSSKIKKGAGTGKNIYISRQKASRRFVENENAVAALLTRYGFEVICMEDYSFADQISVIGGAKNIVSIHGAALATLLFAEPGSSVLEFRGKNDTINNMYYLLSGVCRLQYFYQPCESISYSTVGNNFNLRVDLDALEKNVKLMMQISKP